MEVLWEFLCECLMQFVLEAIAQAGAHIASRRRQRQLSPWLIGPGYALFGAIAGAVSVRVFPDYMIPSETWRIVYLLIGPVVVGAGIAVLGAWYQRRGVPRLRIDRFTYGWLFAFSCALVRYFTAR